MVLSTRETGATGAGFIAVTDPGGTLVEQAGLAKEGQNAEYTIDGVAGSSASNKLTSAIPGVTLELKALTTTTGPVTVDVQPPGPSASKIVAQVQAFVKPLQLDDRGDPEAAHHEAPDLTPERRRTADGDAVRRLRPHEPAQHHAPGDLRTGHGPAGGDVEPRRHRHQHRRAHRQRQPPRSRRWKGSSRSTPRNWKTRSRPTRRASKKMLQSWSKGFQDMRQRRGRPGGHAGNAHQRRQHPGDRTEQQDHEHERNARDPPENAASRIRSRWKTSSPRTSRSPRG